MAKLPIRNVRVPKPPKGWHFETPPARRVATVRERLWVRNGFHLELCTGEAHSNAFIDNCGTCMPLWDVVAVPNVETVTDG